MVFAINIFDEKCMNCDISTQALLRLQFVVLQSKNSREQPQWKPETEGTQCKVKEEWYWNEEW